MLPLPCFYGNCVFYGVLIIVIYFGKKFYTSHKKEKLLEKWTELSKNELIVHCVPKGKTIPSPSPFVMKILTFLRMAKITYKVDYKDPFSPQTGKTPWISYKGEHIADSQLIIEYLNKKFDINLNGDYTDENVAKGDAVRIMLEEHFFWGLALWRFAFEGYYNLEKVMNLKQLWIIKRFIKMIVKKRSKAHGIGLLSKQEIINLTLNDLRITSNILGKNDFILGKEPSEMDAGLFGQISQCVWGFPDSPYEKITNGELKNLKEYAERMRNKYWIDWESECKK